MLQKKKILHGIFPLAACIPITSSQRHVFRETGILRLEDVEKVQCCRNFPPRSLLHLCISQLVLFIQSSFCLRPRFRPKVTYFCNVWALSEGRKLLHSVQNVAMTDECMTALSLYSVYGRLKLKTLRCVRVCKCVSVCVYVRVCVRECSLVV